MTQKTGFFSRIKALSPWHQNLFALCLTERMLPNYQLFAELTESDGSAKVLTIVDTIWQSLYTKNIKLNHERMLNQLEELMPDQNQFEGYGVYPATDALMAITIVLTALQQKVETDLVNVSKLSSSTVAAYIEASTSDDLSDDALEEVVFDHPLMQEEKSIQGQLLDIVETFPRKDIEAIKELRKELRQSGVSNIGITLHED